MNAVVWGDKREAAHLAALLDRDKLALAAFVDSDPAGRGKPFLGGEALAPEALPGLDFDMLVIVGRDWAEPQKRAMESLGVPEGKIRPFHVDRFAFLREYGRPGVIPEGVDAGLIAQLDSKPWYHEVEVFPGVFTPGWARLQHMLLDQIPEGGYTGKRVLDIGAWTGPYTFELERRGADVTSYDIQDPEASGYNLLHGLKGSKARYVKDSVYNLSKHFRKHFDVITYFGVWYHLFNPMLGFTNIHEALADDGIMLFEGAVLEFAYTMDPVWAARKDRMAPYLEVPMAYFTSGDCYGHWSNWYVPNVLCLREWIHAAGFEIMDMYLVPGGSRAYGMARKKVKDVPVEHSR